MLNNGPFYFHSIEKITTAFLYIFNDISIQRIDPDTGVIKEIKVPIDQAAKEKWAVRMEEDPNAGNEETQRHVQIVLPRMSADLTNFHYDSHRKLPAINYRAASNATGVNSITINIAGTGYNNVPILKFTNSSPVSATAIATATVSGGHITGISILSPGYNYNPSSPPSITITPTGGDTPSIAANLTAIIGGPSTLIQLNPIPYIFDFSLHLQTRTLSDSYMIVEQILAFFRPDYVVPIIDIKEMNIHRDIIFTLTACSHQDSFEGSLDTKRVIEWEFSFQAQAFIYPPIKQKPVITTAQVYTPEIGESSTSGGLVEVISNPSGINIDQPYNFIVSEING
jgi:hypothetical protein